MKIIYLFAICPVVFSCDPKEPDPRAETRDFLVAQMDSMQLHVRALETSVVEGKPLKDLQKDFFSARNHFKQVESLTEYYFPVVAESINGPALAEAEAYDDKIAEPTGFQVIEEYIFPAYSEHDNGGLLSELETLVNIKPRFDLLVESNQLGDRNVFEAVRVQLLRIVSLGISGFDSPIAQNSLPEAKAALEGIEKILLFYRHKLSEERIADDLKDQFGNAYRYLEANNDFNKFDRAEFIVNYLTPLSGSIYGYQQALGIGNNEFTTALDPNETNFFSDKLFNIEFFSPTPRKKKYREAAALGKILFFDPILSGNNKRSCASCHQPAKAFSDNKKKSVAFNFEKEVSRNTPTLINSGFQKNQFWDQRVHFIEDQVTDVITNPEEMHGSIEKSFSILMKSPEYVHLFQRAFGTTTSPARIREALATYIRSLTGLNSDFDRYMRGDKSALTNDEITGFNLFMGKAKCATCHFAPLFNGSVPPSYSETEAEILGVSQKFDTINAVVDQDLGKYNAYERELFKNSFKTPTIRNAGLTAPYMHNGAFQTLEQVIDFYNRGGGAGIGIDLPNQTLPPDKLGLTSLEQRQIISFIHALTDTTGLTSLPDKLPSFNDPVLNKRPVGGIY